MMEDRLGDLSLLGDEGEDFNLEVGVEGHRSILISV